MLQPEPLHDFARLANPNTTNRAKQVLACWLKHTKGE